MREAAKTKSDRSQMAAGKEWEDCLDQHAMTAADVMIGREASEEELNGVERVEVLWKSAYQWGRVHAFREKRAEGVGLRVVPSKTNQYEKRDVQFLVMRGTTVEDIDHRSAGSRGLSSE